MYLSTLRKAKAPVRFIPPCHLLNLYSLHNLHGCSESSQADILIYAVLKGSTAKNRKEVGHMRLY